MNLIHAYGGIVFVLGHRRPRGSVYYGTMQSSGLPDLCAFVRTRAGQSRQVWIEVKAAGGRLRAGQARFRAACLRAGIDHVVGGVAEVKQYLRALA